MDGLPSGLAPRVFGGWPTGIELRDENLYITIGEGDTHVNGPAPGTIVPNPNGPSSPIFANCTDPSNNKITADQRGITRPQGKGCDIGACTSTGLLPASKAMTLQIANYTLTLPAGSFHPLWNAANAPYIYDGTANGVKLLLGLIPMGKNQFQFDSAGSPVTFPGLKNPVTISLSFGNDSGTTTVDAIITPY